MTSHGQTVEAMGVEITIGVQHVARELVLETDQTSEKIAKDVLKALEVGAPIELTDTRGRRLIVPAGTLGYIEIGGDETRKVGFHNI
jgi:non-ribosomal peptide synthetase component F